MKHFLKCSIADLKEYSKKIIQQMINIWFIGAAFGMIIVTAEVVTNMILIADSGIASITVHLPELLAYIGAPVGGGILGYLLKSAFENREKIKNNTSNGGSNEEYCDSEADRLDMGDC